MGQAAVIQFTARLEATDCYKCGVTFAMPSAMMQNARNKGADVTFYCPNGHGQVFVESEAERLRKQLALKDAEIARERSSAQFWRDQNDSTGRALSAARGQATKLRKRIAHGVCPCCKRTFKQLSQHMASQHPDYATPVSENEK